MGQAAVTLNQLADLLSAMPPAARVLELGDQDVTPDISLEEIRIILQKLHRGDEEKTNATLERVFGTPRPWKAADFFRGSTYDYRCIDLFPGEFTLVLDLNDYVVPDHQKETFDIVTNHGTTEHIGDQMNAFRVIHDFAKPGAIMIHYVPFAGYFNHELYNYHPVFFVFLAHANNYEIINLELSKPHLPYTIPLLEGVHGTEHWQKQIDSGGVISLLRKTDAAPFKKVTDCDAVMMGHRKLASPWQEMVQSRYDLRVRTPQ